MSACLLFEVRAFHQDFMIDSRKHPWLGRLAFSKFVVDDGKVSIARRIQIWRRQHVYQRYRASEQASYSVADWQIDSW